MGMKAKSVCYVDPKGCKGAWGCAFRIPAMSQITFVKEWMFRIEVNGPLLFQGGADGGSHAEQSAEGFGALDVRLKFFDRGLNGLDVTGIEGQNGFERIICGDGLDESLESLLIVSRPKLYNRGHRLGS